MIEAAEAVRLNLGRDEEGRRWLDALPALVGSVLDDWELTPGEPFTDGSASWVAPVTTAEGGDAVLKVGWPHPEAREEAAGLRVWDGAGAVRLLRHDAGRWALLVERCDPGVALHRSGLPTDDALAAGAEVLRELWSVPAPGPGQSSFDEIAGVTQGWAALVRERMERHRPPFDAALVEAGARLLATLPVDPPHRVLVHGDANPGNLRSATRRPWLAIDAKPMLGDAGYDPSPLVLQVDPPPHEDAAELARRFRLVGDVTGEDPVRLLAWAVARTVESALWQWHRGDHDGATARMALARRLADGAGL